MADVVLLHSAAGLRPAVRRAADRLRAAGHTVTLPDLYAGEVFTDLEQGVALMNAIGWPELLGRAEAAVADVSADAVLMGMSMGAGLAATLALDRPQTRGVVLLYGPELPEEPLPAGLPVLAQHASGDPWVDPGSEAALVARCAELGLPLTLHVYPGAGHLLDDDDLPDQHLPAAARLVWPRVEAFLAELA